MTKETSDTEEDYYLESSEESKYVSSLIFQKSFNVITNKSQKEFLIDLIGKISDPETKKEYLENLKGLILEEENNSFRINPEISTFSKISERYFVPNPCQLVTTKELQTEVNELKTQVCLIKKELLNRKTKDLELKAKLSPLESQITKPTNIPSPLGDITGIPDHDIFDNQFLQTLSQLTF